MKPMSILVALIASAIVLSTALLTGSYGVAGEISYGWIESFYMGNYYLYGAVSSLLVLIGGIIVFSVLSRCGMYGHFKSYLPVLLYSSMMSLAVGSKFLYIAVAGLYIVYALFLLAPISRNSEPIYDFIFKMVMLVFLLTILHPAMIWLILPLIGNVVYFRSSVGKELSVLLLSFILFSAVSLWCSWFFGFDMSVVIDSLWPEFSFCSSVLCNSVALGMFIFVLLCLVVFKESMSNMDALTYKIEDYSLFCILFMSLLSVVLGSEWIIPLFAAPVSIIIFVHYESLKSIALKRLLIVIFFLTIVIIGGFMLCHDSFVQLLDVVWSAVKQLLI